MTLDLEVTLKHLVLAKEAFAKNARVAALEELLLAWRSSRAPPIAEVIDVVSADIARAGFTMTGEMWHDYRALDLPLLLASLAVGDWQPIVQNLAQLEKWPDDPRIAATLAMHASAFRWRQTASLRLYKRLFPLLARQRDPRSLRSLRERERETYGRYSFHEALQHALTKVIDDMPEALSLDEAARGLVRTLDDEARRLYELAIPTRESLNDEHKAWHAQTRAVPSMQTEDSLLAEILAAPNDDGPRVVLGDFWLERQDPRGEIMALGLKPNRKASEEKTFRKLLKTHGHRLLGPLAKIIDVPSAEFRRGLLSKCECRFVLNEVRAGLIGHSLWATVEDLQCDDPELIVNPSLRALHTLRTSADCLANIKEPVPTVKTLWLVGVQRETETRLTRLHTQLPNVRTVGIRLSGFGGRPISPEFLPFLFTPPFSNNIEEMIVDASFGWSSDPRLDRFVERFWKASSRFARLRCWLPRSTTEILITKSGLENSPSLRMHIAFGKDPVTLHSMVFVLGKLDKSQFEHVSAEMPPVKRKPRSSAAPSEKAVEEVLAPLRIEWLRNIS